MANGGLVAVPTYWQVTWTSQPQNPGKCAKLLGCRIAEVHLSHNQNPAETKVHPKPCKEIQRRQLFLAGTVRNLIYPNRFQLSSFPFTLHKSQGFKSKSKQLIQTKPGGVL